MAKFIKKRFPALFVATYFIVAASMVGFLIYPAIFGQASVAADFTNTGAATATWGPSYTDRLVLDVTIPDAWSGGAFTADILYWDAGTVDNWQGDTLNAFAALGTTTGVGYVEDLVDPGFQTTEGVVADLDADSVVTSAADDLVDGDGSGSTGIGTVDPAAAGGDPILAMGDNAGHGGLAICADSLFPWVLTALRIDTNGDCTDGAQTEGTYLVGTNATAAATETNGTWAFGDAVTMGGNADGDYDDGEDIFYENNVGELTYSAGADGNYIVGAGVGSVISNFPADCDGAGAGSEACKYTGAGAFDGNSNIYIDDGTAGGAAPNSVVDRQDDLLVGLGVQNTGTAVDTTDISAVEVWADAGAAGFQGLGTDTNIGTMTVNSGDTKEWRLGGLTQAVAATVGQRIFVTVDLTATPTNARTLKFQIPVYNDVGADSVATADDDVGVFMESTNDGPTNAVVLNANTQTIDSAAPTISSRVTSDNDNDGHIDRITFTTNENLDDDFSALTITVDGYIVESYDTGGSANDNIFIVIFTEGGSFDTGVTPDIRITMNTTLGDAYGNNIAVDGAPVASTDGAIPTIGTVTYKDEDGDGMVDRIMLTYTETVTADSVVSANDLVFDNVGSFTSAAFGGNAGDLVTGAVSFTNINLGTEASVIATYDATTLLAISTQNAFSLTDGTNTTLLQGSQTQVTIADGAAPVLGGDGGVQMYLDGNSDGSIDTFQTWWSENVTMTGSTVDDWTISGGDFNAAFSAAADDADGNQVISVTVSSDANKTGSTAAPTISYDNGDANGSVKDTALNSAGTTGPQTLIDGVAPRPVSAAYKDADGDGTVDRIDVTMTGEASISCTFQLADWSIPTAGTVIGANTPSACVVFGNDIQITVAATADKTGGGTSPTINYSNIAPKGSVTDAGNLNQAPSFSAPVTATDGAAPVILNTYSVDSDVDGDVDAMDIAFSEDITDASVVAANFEFDNDATNNATGEEAGSGGSTTVVYPGADADANDQYYRLTVTNGVAGTDLAYLHHNTLGLTDTSAALNQLALGDALGTENDRAAPYLVSATYSDATPGGKIDTVTFVFSESTTWTAITTDDWAFSAAGDVGLVGDFAAAECTASPSVTYVCTDAGTGTVDATTDRTGKQTGAGSEPTFTYTNSANDINDTTNNTATFGPITLVDGAAPLITTRVTKDTNSATGAAGTVDGDLDGVLATFTEIMDASTAAVTDFVITLNDGTAKTEAYSDATDDTTLFFGLSNPTANDTADLLKLQITGGDSIQDLSTVPNSVAAEGAASAATDGAAPFLVSATYRDLDASGAIDTLRTTWTENVTLAHDNSVDWTIAPGSSINAVFSSAAVDLVAGTTLDVTVTADANETSSAVAPTIAYDNDDANNSVTDGTGNATGTNAAVTATDVAAPVVTSRATTDADSDGQIDRIIFTTTENLDDDFTGLTTDISGFVGEAYVTGGSANDTIFWVNFTESGAIDTSAIPDTQITANTSLSDASSNNINTDSVVVASTDGALPVLIGGSYRDLDGDGEIDTLRVTWSESVTVSSSTAVDWTVTGGSMNETFASADDSPGLGTDKDVTVTADPDETGGAIAPTIAYDNGDANNSVQDASLNSAGTSGPVTLIDLAAPIIVNTYSADPDGDGDVNAIDIAFSENISDATVTATRFEFDNDTTNNAVGEETGSGGSSTVVYPSADADANDQYYRLTVTTGITGTEKAYLHMNTSSLQDTIGNSMATGSALGTENDEADPIVMSTSPADNATGVALDASFSITFSEAMTTTDITTTTLGRSPTFTLGSVNGTWTSGNTVVTFAAHDAWAGLQIYTINLDQVSINSAATGDSTLDTTSVVVADPYTFTTVAASTGGGGGGGGLPASVSVFSPNGGEVWAGLSSKNITWSSTSSTITKVKLFYSLDRGVNFPYTIATNENNDGAYSWAVPNIPSRTVKIKVEGYDSNSVFVASDISDADFTITYVTPPVAPPGTTPPAENPAGLIAGDLLKSPLSTTVYYYGSDNKRHIFPNEKTYKSWYPDWSNVKSVTAEELRAIPLGKNVIVRPGTVLVKIDTNPKVYAIEPGGLLRWIPTEARIKTLYGDDWAEKIIDVPLAFWGDYSFGSDISADTHPTGALVQYTGTTDIYYIQGAEKRKVTTAGFTANNFRSENVIVISATLSYANGADIFGAESSLTSIY